MSAFDGYHEWLGIPPEDQPPNHYQLLGIDVFESGLDVIDAAARKHMANLREVATGPHSDLSKKLLHEITAARLCLAMPDTKTAYDARLRRKFANNGQRPELGNPSQVDENFDPYHKWLGIPVEQRPPTHYQLLRISRNETDREVITAAADRQMGYVRQFRGGLYDELAASIIYQIDEARVTLLNPDARRDYDSTLTQAPKRRKRSEIGVLGPMLSSGSHSVGEGRDLFRQYVGIVSVLIVGFAVMAFLSLSLPWQRMISGDTPLTAPQPIEPPKLKRVLSADIIADDPTGEIVVVDVIIRSVDAARHRISFTKTWKGKAKDLVLNLDTNANIFVGGNRVVLGALKPGQRAVVSYDAGLQIVTAIATDGPASAGSKGTTVTEKDMADLESVADEDDTVVVIDGIIKAVNLAERSITVTKTWKGNPKDIELKVERNAKVVIGGKEATLNAVRPGQDVVISYQTDREAVTKLEAFDPKPSATE